MEVHSYLRDALYLGSMLILSVVIVGIVYSLSQGEGPLELVTEMATNPFWWLLIGVFLFVVMLPGYRKAKQD
ncbi:hypothetical protein [Halorubrum sp. DTA46]|uniref:hypothetical protein n=1 Tax=Halorubrum sp. DTA46 TaxID=3402162 RepID=UPI003AACE0EB